jgi:hypothetical protein
VAEFSFPRKRQSVVAFSLMLFKDKEAKPKVVVAEPEPQSILAKRLDRCAEQTHA